MYPYERSLVKRLENKAFVMLGINCDNDREVFRKAVSSEKMSWRSWWSGSTEQFTIYEQWKIRALPTFYLLDQKGVIRRMFVGQTDSKELDEAIDALVKEAEGNLEKSGKEHGQH